MSRKQLLYITNEFRLPTGTGAHVRQANLIRQYALVFDVTLLGSQFSSRDLSSLDAFLRENTVASHFVQRSDSSALGEQLERHLWLPKVVRDFPTTAFRRGLAVVLNAHGPYDVTHVHALGAVHVVAPDLRKRKGSKHYVVDLDSSEFARRLRASQRPSESTVLRMKRRIEPIRVRIYERRWLPLFDCAFLASSKEAADTRKRVSTGNIRVVQNGFDIEAVSKGARQRNQRDALLLFVGTLSFEPNCEALDFMVKEVLPRLRARRTDIRLAQVGALSSTSAARFGDCEELEMMGFVDDLGDAYASAAVVVAPMLDVSGSNIKILEAAAYGKAIVTTSNALSGFALRDGHDVLVADSPGEFARKVEYLLESPAERERLGRNAKASVERLYSWGHAGEQLRKALAEVLREC